MQPQHISLFIFKQTQKKNFFEKKCSFLSLCTKNVSYEIGSMLVLTAWSYRMKNKNIFRVDVNIFDRLFISMTRNFMKRPTNEIKTGSINTKKM